MRNNKLVVAVLVLVLLIGGAFGAYLILQPGDGPTNAPRVGELDSGEPGSSGQSDDPLATQPGQGGNQSGTTGPGAGSTPDVLPQPGTDKPDDGTDVNKQPVNPGTEPIPAEQQWEEVNLEMSVHGRVTFKSDGRAAVGAAVNAELSTESYMWWGGYSEPAASGRPKGSVGGSTTTDGAGEYTLNLSVKTYRLKGRAVEDNDRSGRFPGGGWGNEQLVVTATMAGYAPAKSAGIFPQAGQDQEVNLKLAIPAAVSGRIIDAVSRKGIAGARGQLQDAEAWNDGGTVPRGFTTDEQGYFSVNSLPASTYGLTVQASGYANYNGWQGQGRINLAAGGEKDLGEIGMMPAASVVGRVLSEEDGQPLHGARVELRQNNQWGGWSTKSVTTDAEGRFALSDVEPGVYTVRAHINGYAQLELANQAVEAGARLDLGDLKLGRGLSLSGVVTGPDDKPVVGAGVSLGRPSEGFGWGGENDEITSALTGQDGTFTLTGVNEGSLRLSVRADKFAPHTETIQVSGSREGLRIKLSRGGSVKGRVLTAAGEPVAGAGINAIDHNSQAYSLFKTQRSAMWGLAFMGGGSPTTSAEDGSFVLSNVPEGTYLIMAGGQDNQPVFKDHVRIENDREIDVGDLRLPGKGSLRVTVTEDGVPVAELGVSLAQGMAYGNVSEHQAATDAMGVATIKDVPAGEWFIRTDRDEGTFDTDNTRRRVQVKEGAVTEFALELRPKDGVHLHGKLTLNGRAAFNDIILIGTGDRADVVKTAKPVEGGFYEFVGLKPGSYVLHARESDRHSTCKIALDLKQEGEFPFDHDFKAFAVSGTVNTPDNSPAQRTKVSVTLVHVENEKPEFAQWLRGRATPDSDGRFRFENVMPGKYVLSAALDGVGTATAQVTVGSADESGLTLNIAQNSGSIQLTIAKLHGTAVSGNGFGLVSLETPDGAVVNLGESFQGFFMLSEGSRQTIPTVEPGTYTVVVKGSGFLTSRSADVQVANGKATEVTIELTAAAELQLAVSNSEITQQMLDAASVRYFDAEGVELARESNVLDSFGGPAPSFEKPTLVARYLGPKVAEVRVKLAGYTELSVSVQFAAGKKIEKEEALQSE
jgi:hypothetical protein